MKHCPRVRSWVGMADAESIVGIMSTRTYKSRRKPLWCFAVYRSGILHAWDHLVLKHWASFRGELSGSCATLILSFWPKQLALTLNENEPFAKFHMAKIFITKICLLICSPILRALQRTSHMLWLRIHSVNFLAEFCKECSLENTCIFV